MRVQELLTGITLAEAGGVGPGRDWNPHQMGPAGSVPSFAAPGAAPMAPRPAPMAPAAPMTPGPMAANTSGGDANAWINNKWNPSPSSGQAPANMLRPPAPVAPTPTPGNMGKTADMTPEAPTMPTPSASGTASSSPSIPSPPTPTQTA